MRSIFTLLSKELNICKNIPNEIHIRTLFGDSIIYYIITLIVSHKTSSCTKSSPMEPYFKLVVVDDDEVAKVKDDVAPANTCTNNTNSLDKEDLLCTQLQLLV